MHRDPDGRVKDGQQGAGRHGASVGEVGETACKKKAEKMSDKLVLLVSACAGIGALLLLWLLMYLATGRFYPFGLLISIGVAVLTWMHLRERWPQRGRD